jgi:2-polyprenyl-3-methyl-5-hydroxy-6-metoxy-1,4-benzoquinol methylase
MNKKHFFSLITDKIEVGQYIEQHYLRFIKIVNEIDRLFRGNTDKKKIRILDFGSHTGVLGIALKALGYDIHSIDLEEVIQANVGNYTKNDLPFQYLKNDWSRLPYSANYFDCIIFSEVLEHLYESPLKCLEEFHRLLKQDGYLLITTPNVMRIENKIKFFLNINIYQDIERYCYNPRYSLHFREYSKKDLRILLTEYLGYKNIEFNLFNYYGGRSMMRKLVQRILYFVSIVLPMFKESILAVAQKK